MAHGAGPSRAGDPATPPAVVERQGQVGPKRTWPSKSYFVDARAAPKLRETEST